MRKLVLVIFFFFLVAYLPCRSQIVNSDNRIKFEELAPEIEKKHQVKIYFKTEWFSGKLFRKNLVDLPLTQSLDIIKRLSDLNYSFIPPATYVFVPIEIRNYTHRVNSDGLLMVGDGPLPENQQQVNVSGQISDYETGKPLPGARINIDKLNMVTYANEMGQYNLQIPTGDYDLRLNYSDYKENVRPIRVSGNGIVDFELAEIAVLLREVLITDKAADMNLIQTQMSAIQLNAKTIKELPLFLGEKDIMKGLTLLPGVQSTGEFGTGFFVRGGSADQNLILVEDVPMFNSAHLFGLNSALNSDAISQVTFLKGGIPAKYGERVSSVMDIRMGTNPQKLAVKGGLGLLNSRLSIETPLFNKKVKLLLGGRSSYSNWLLHAMPDAELKKSSAAFYDLNALLSIRFDEKNSLSLFGYFSNDEFSFTQNSPYHYDNTLASLRYTHNFNDKFSSTFVLGHSRYRNDVSQWDSLKLNESYKISSAINYSKAKLNFNWLPNKKHNIDFGVDVVNYNLQPGMLSPLDNFSTVIPLNVSAENALENAVYLSDNIEFTDKFSAEIGFRYTQYSDSGINSPEPRLSMRYSIDDFSSVKFSYNKNNQYINLITNTAVMAPTDVYKMSTAHLPPLSSNQWAIGYFRNFNENAIETSVELYYKKLNNILEYRDGARILLNEQLEKDLLHASGYNYGAEFYIKKNTGKMTGWASYTYSRSLRHTTSNIPENQINKNEYYPSSFDKPHNIVINANHQLSRRWRFAWIFNYNTGKAITLPELKYQYNGQQYVYYSDRNKYRLPDFHRLDIAITFDETLRLKQKWKGSWTLSILNLYGHKNPYSVFYKTSSQVESKFYQSFNLYQMFIIERPIPTFTYNFSF